MSKSDPNPPYFNIAPDRAEAELGAGLGTADFAEIAGRFIAGREALAARGLNPEGTKTLRLFSTWEITRYLIPVAQAHFRRVLKANPDLPQPSVRCCWAPVQKWLLTGVLFRTPVPRRNG